MLLNCPVNGNAQSREPVNQDYSRASKRQKETIIRFKNIAFPLPHSRYLNLHLIGSLQHCQNCILRSRRSFQTFMQRYMLGSQLLLGMIPSARDLGMRYQSRKGLGNWPWIKDGTDTSMKTQTRLLKSEAERTGPAASPHCTAGSLRARVGPFHLTSPEPPRLPWHIMGIHRCFWNG